jgi:hypothetical protein
MVVPANGADIAEPALTPASTTAVKPTRIAASHVFDSLLELLFIIKTPLLKNKINDLAPFW